jgi:hypothetical protein
LPELLRVALQEQRYDQQRFHLLDDHRVVHEKVLYEQLLWRVDWLSAQ